VRLLFDSCGSSHARNYHWANATES
jgi:hypothetical protein